MVKHMKFNTTMKLRLGSPTEAQRPLLTSRLRAESSISAVWNIKSLHCPAKAMHVGSAVLKTVKLETCQLQPNI